MMFLKRYSKFFASFGIIFCLLSFVPQNVFGQENRAQRIGGQVISNVANYMTPAGLAVNGSRYISDFLVGLGGNECGFSSLHICFWSLLNWAAEVWITFLGWFLAMAGGILNYTIEFTILDLKDTVDNPALAEIWVMIRDLVNIGMIFMVLYIAILTIVQANASATKKMLGGIIFVAIFVNFSLFTTKLLIDASNRVTLVFYNAIVSTTQEGVEGGTYGGTPTGTLGGSVAGIVLNQLNLKTFYKTEASFEENAAGGALGRAQPTGAGQPVPPAGSRAGSIAIGLIGGSAYIVVAIYTFLAISLMLIIRFAILILLLVFSPAGFLLGITSGLNNNWWKELWKNLLFPPAMFLMLWVSIYILSVSVKNGATDDWFNALTNMQSVTSSLFVKFFLAIVLLLSSMIIANKIGATGAAQLQSWVNKSSKSMLGGMAGFAGRNTFGRAGRWAGNVYDNQIGNKLYTSRETLKNISSDPKKNGVIRALAGLGGGVVGGLNTVGTRTARAGLAQVEGGKYGSARSLKEEEDLVRKEKFTQRAVEERIQNETYVKQYAELQKQRDEIQVESDGITKSIGDLIKIEEAAAKAEKDRTEEEKNMIIAFEKEVGVGVKDGLDKFRNKRDDAIDKHYKDTKVPDRAGKEGGVAMADIAKKFSKLGDKDIEMMLEENPSLATDSKFLRMLSPDQVKGLTKREGVTASEIGEIKKNYKNEMVSASRGGMFGRMNAIGTGELTGGMDSDAFAAFFESSINSGIASRNLSDRINGGMLGAAYSNITDAKARASIDAASQRLFKSAVRKDGTSDIVSTGDNIRPFAVSSTAPKGEIAHLNKIATMMNWYHKEMSSGNASYNVDLSIIKPTS
jgi:hypothetical protein